MRKRSNPVAIVLLCAGGLMIAAALCLTLRNLKEEDQAARQAEDSLRQIVAQLPEPSPEGTGSAGPLVPQESAAPAEAAELPTVTVNGAEYIGTLSLPALGLTLPVLRDWSDELLKLAPCRYQGSVQTGDLLLVAHNYRLHFGRLKNLSPGDTVTFTDVNGGAYAYAVAEVKQFDAPDMETIKAGDWDLMLFTCTIDGAGRIAAYCVLEDE